MPTKGMCILGLDAVIYTVIYHVRLVLVVESYDRLR